MKRLGLDANSSFPSRKFYWKIFQEALPSQSSVSALRWVISGPVTLSLLLESSDCHRHYLSLLKNCQCIVACEWLLAFILG